MPAPALRRSQVRPKVCLHLHGGLFMEERGEYGLLGEMDYRGLREAQSSLGMRTHPRKLIWLPCSRWRRAWITPWEATSGSGASAASSASRTKGSLASAVLWRAGRAGGWLVRSIRHTAGDESWQQQQRTLQRQQLHVTAGPCPLSTGYFDAYKKHLYKQSRL